jgi:hypothetical protein
MSIEDLNNSVTIAILNAEALPTGSWEAEHAFREVSELEQELAAIVGAQTVQGEVARLGAVAASLSAGDLLRAVQLAEPYLADALSDRSRKRLEHLHAEAEAEIARAAATSPNVAPIPFILKAA